jgi:hypothetical protein
MRAECDCGHRLAPDVAASLNYKGWMTMPMTRTTTTLADVAATSLNAVRTFERHGLDYCCGGKQPFDEACLAKGLKPESVMQEV